MSYSSVMSTRAAFDRYEEIRSRLPSANFGGTSQKYENLAEVAEHVDAFILDAFGVLNVGATPIINGVERMVQLREMGKKLIVLTNAASDSHSFAIEKFRKLGYDFSADEIVTSRDVCANYIKSHLPVGRWGAICKKGDTLDDLDLDVVEWTLDRQPDVDGFLLLSSERMNDSLLWALENSLKVNKRPVICANPDLVAPREVGLSCEPGYFTHALADRTSIVPSFFGKPFGNAFDAVLKRLGNIEPHRIAMVGDTLHTDVLGGAAAGVRTVLITNHGLFAGLDVNDFIERSGIRPDFICPTT